MPNEDADLDDLLHSSNEDTHHLLSSKLEMEPPPSKAGKSAFAAAASPKLLLVEGRIAALFNFLSFVVSSRPFLFLGGCSAILIFFIVATVFSVQHEISPMIAARINNDYSSINSQYDFSLGKIDHWCIFVRKHHFFGSMFIFSASNLIFYHIAEGQN
jgi:hypothetical protein